MTFATHPDFLDRAHPQASRVTYQFTVTGPRQTGVVYVTTNVPADDHLAHVAEAARIVSTRGGDACPVLCAIENPRR